MTDKRPRHYAAEIAEIPTREKRNAALARVPEHLREMVKAHVITHFNLKKHSKSK